ncbi:MAG: DUF5329 domain-containing protein [Dokdonella sp.]
MKRFLAIAVFSLGAVLAAAAELSASSRADIDRLLSTLGSSDCEFYRNGHWYSAGQAQDHLKRKYDYLLDKGAVASAEAFIAEAGTKSSMSGTPYQVRCPHEEAQPSAVWLGNALRRIREARRP